MTRFRRVALAWLIILPMLLSFQIQEAGARDGAAKVIEIKIENRKLVTPKGKIRVTEQDVVELRYMSDETVNLHLHGYDRKIQVRPGKQAVMLLTTKATGRFPITSHGWGKKGHGHGHHVLTHLEVYPR